MATPAFRRSGDMENGGSGEGGQSGVPASGGAFAAHTTADLIALRDKLLEECLDLERRTAEPQGEGEDPGAVRERIDEIHQELAMRDLAERVRPAGGPPASGARPVREEQAANGDIAAHASCKAIQILEAIEMRSRFMDELAQAAKEQGRLDQAAAFTMNAQQFDLERVEVLRKLTALRSPGTASGDPGDD
jgi:hypothetical protein